MATKTIIICDGCGKECKHVDLFNAHDDSLYKTILDCVIIKSGNNDYHVCPKCYRTVNNLKQSGLKFEGWL